VLHQYNRTNAKRPHADPTIDQTDPLDTPNAAPTASATEAGSVVHAAVAVSRAAASPIRNPCAMAEIRSARSSHCGSTARSTSMGTAMRPTTAVDSTTTRAISHSHFGDIPQFRRDFGF
jgi:hypothetical protein